MPQFDFVPPREGQMWPTHVCDIWGAALRILFNTDVVGE